jgi:predicted nuclease of predicted toxin-antitoxin system
MIARLYSNENFPLPAVEALRRFGHDVVTSQEAGRSQEAIPDEDVLDFAISEGRAVITHNRRDFIQLHRERPAHPGIVVCTENPDFLTLAAKVHARIETLPSLVGQLVRINRGD